MPPTKGSFRNYSEDNMRAAIEDVRLHKTPIRTAARKFGVPRITLKYKVEGKTPIERKMGPPSILKKNEEDQICLWIEKMAAAGFPVTSEEVTVSVQRAIKEIKRPNPFKDDRPGRTWMKGFLKRNPTISKRISQNLTSSRAGITKDNIMNWFSEVYQYLKENNLENILENPSRIFNCDETAFFLNPKGNKVLAKKGNKNVYQQVNSDEKECVTVLITGSASGIVAPTTILFKYKRIPQEITENFPKEWGLGKTDSGWMTCEAFFEFIADIFHPWLVKTQITLPVILFIDGHASHLSMQTSQFCDSHGIVLVALYPNATHLLQPLDVAVFRTLKEGWKNKVHEWRIKNLDAPTLKKKDFPKLLEEVIDVNITETILSNGFRKCGLYPWNPLAVEVPIQEKQINNSTETRLLRMKYWKQGLDFLNDIIEVEKLDTFQCSSEKWTGNQEDTSLFMLWKKTQMEFKKYSTPVEQTSSDNAIPAVLLQENNTPAVQLANDVPLQAVLPQSVKTPSNVSVAGPSNGIPSPFKRHFYYQNVGNEKTKKKRKIQERMPTIVSGKLCQEYFLNKIKKREEMERLKRERAAERQRKREEKEKIKEKKTQKLKLKRAKKELDFSAESSDSSIEISDSIESERNERSNDENTQSKNNNWLPVEKRVNEHVVFLYEGEYFPGKVLHVAKDKATISSMQKCGRLWKWPESLDVLDYEWKAVISHIDDPRKVSKTRNVYSVPELDFRWK